MRARDEVLRRVRSALGTDTHVPDVPRAYRTTTSADRNDVLALFAQRVTGHGASVTRVLTHEVASAVDAVLSASERVVIPAGLPDIWHPTSKTYADDDLSPEELAEIDVVLTSAAVAIAETGTIVLDGSAGQGRRAATLVPDHHICIVRSEQVLDNVPAALERLDARTPQTWISGPSATSDIELQRVEGVHGPRRLTVFLVLEDASKE